MNIMELFNIYITPFKTDDGDMTTFNDFVHKILASHKSQIVNHAADKSELIDFVDRSIIHFYTDSSVREWISNLLNSNSEKDPLSSEFRHDDILKDNS